MKFGALKYTPRATIFPSFSRVEEDFTSSDSKKKKKDEDRGNERIIHALIS